MKPEGSEVMPAAELIEITMECRGCGERVPPCVFTAPHVHPDHADVEGTRDYICPLRLNRANWKIMQVVKPEVK